MDANSDLNLMDVDLNDCVWMQIQGLHMHPSTWIQASGLNPRPHPTQRGTTHPCPTHTRRATSHPRLVRHTGGGHC